MLQEFLVSVNFIFSSKFPKKAKVVLNLHVPHMNCRLEKMFIW